MQIIIPKKKFRSKQKFDNPNVFPINSKAEAEGIKDLWRNVLIQAFLDTLSHERNSRAKNIKYKALSFFDKNNMFFLKLCEILNYDANWILTQLANMKTTVGLRKLQRTTLVKIIGK